MTNSVPGGEPGGCRKSGCFFLAAVGGSLGALLAMFLFRHKTKHLKFTIGVPVILGLQIFLGVNFFIASQ